ncbi:unnamed protein product [Rotaria sp. Silwood2]|nr:unnamed protein product [Rotaria sp. Silwood2]CAF3433678.1 unnamed protein product [Rotaria sp. Silwood2]
MHQKATHDSSQHHPDITMAATRYAQTRFPFSPFIIRFSTGNVKDKQVAEEISLFFKNEHQIDILFSNYRSSTFKCSSNEYDILLFVKDANSFTSLLDEDKWPPQIGSQYYTFPSSPSIPPQLSLIIKNVDFYTDMNVFSDDLKGKFPEIKNVIRLKNKFQQDIKIVKIEFVSTLARNQILAAGKININYRSYDVEEYIAPARVLICSKCCGIGHFKRQCTQSSETSLTKKLLTTNYNSTSTFNWFKYDPVQFPQLNPSHNSSITGSHNMILSKLNELAVNMEKMNDNISKITVCNEKFEKFMNDKIDSDKIIKQEINVLKHHDKALEANQVQHELKLKRYENILVKLLLPMLDEMSKVILLLNHDQHGRPCDPGLKTNLEIIRTKLKLALEDEEDSIDLIDSLNDNDNDNNKEKCRIIKRLIRRISYSFIIRSILLIPLFIYLLLILTPIKNIRSFIPEEIKKTKNFLIFVAHPDDECLFFSPTILSLISNDKKGHIVVISTGNSNGLGPIREKELKESCQRLNIDLSRCISLNLTNLQDNQHRWWPKENISELVEIYIKKYNIDLLITFDRDGISGHLNHKSIAIGVEYYIEKTSKTPLIYQISTVPLLFEFSSIIDLFRTIIKFLPRLFRSFFSTIFPFLFSPPNDQHALFVISPFGYIKGLKAFHAHRSQMLWYRHIYTTFSRHMFINDLTKVSHNL